MTNDQRPNLFLRASNSHLADFDSWNSNSDGNLLSFFSAYADAGIQLKIVADSGHMFERFWTITPQRRSPHGRGHFAVFDQVSFRRGEREFPVGDVDLTPAELHSIQTPLHRSDYVIPAIEAG